MRADVKYLIQPIYYDNRGSFFQLFKKNNELYFRFILEYSYSDRSDGRGQNHDNTIQMGYTDKVSNITYGSLIDKIDKVYKMRRIDLHSDYGLQELERYEKEEGSFSVGRSKDNLYYETHGNIKNFQLQDTNNIIIIYLGKDKDYYFASTDLKMYNNYFCMEAISNNNEKIILKCDIISSYIKKDGSAQDFHLDTEPYTSALFNHNLIVEKLENSDIAVEDFALQYDVERMAKINAFLQKYRLGIDNKWHQYNWNNGEKQHGISIDPYQATFESWLDTVHEAGLDDNDLF
mgnify:FL=1